MVVPVSTNATFSPENSLPSSLDLPPSPRAVRLERVVWHAFGCLTLTIGVTSVCAILGGAYCIFSPDDSDNAPASNYPKQIAGTVLLALGTLGCCITGCLSNSKRSVAQTQYFSHEEMRYLPRDEEDLL